MLGYYISFMYTAHINVKAVTNTELWFMYEAF